VWLPPTLEAGERNKFARKPKESQPEQTQFLTIAGDGQLLVWDTRRAIEVLEQEKGTKGEPGEKTEKDKKQKEGWGAKLAMPLLHTESGAELSVTSLILDVPAKENAICRLLAVSEDGEYVTVNLLEPNTEGAKGTIAGGVRAVSLGHYGPCTALERSPFVPDVYLSVGDWSFNLWKDGVSTPLFVAPFAGVGPNARLTCGAWSPTRPGVIFIGRSDGGIDVWDLLDRSHEPSTSFTVAGSAVLRLSFTEASGTLSKAVSRSTPRHTIPHRSSRSYYHTRQGGELSTATNSARPRHTLCTPSARCAPPHVARPRTLRASARCAPLHAARLCTPLLFTSRQSEARDRQTFGVSPIPPHLVLG
jgi:hypothetical protein